MGDIIIGFLVILAILLIWGLYHLFCKNTLCEMVSWCMSTKHYDVLASAFIREQKDLNISEAYRITNSSEKQAMVDIIKYYRNDLSKDFWDGEISADFKILRLSVFDYAMMSLNRFLNTHTRHWGFADEKYIIEDGIYKLTDFGIAFYKMHYAVLTICLGSKRLTRLVHPLEGFELKRIKAILDNKDNIDRDNLL